MLLKYEIASVSRAIIQTIARATIRIVTIQDGWHIRARLMCCFTPIGPSIGCRPKADQWIRLIYRDLDLHRFTVSENTELYRLPTNRTLKQFDCD